MKKALIVSFKFHPGHISHLIASYKQFEDLGYESWFLINKKSVVFLERNKYNIIDNNCRIRPDVVLFLFPHPKNIIQIIKKKIVGSSQIIYVFHEPLTKLSVYRESGFSSFNLLKLAIGNIFDILVVLLSDIVILPSKKAIMYYQENKLYKNRRYKYIPLMYDDERTEKHIKLKREFFSYIGTIAADHSYNEYFSFVKWAVNNGSLINLKFKIATKEIVERNGEMEKMINTGRLVVCDGHPLSNEEINNHYASSLVIWNAYNRMTQSGVLAKAFMFGTPAIMMRHNLNEFAHDGEEVVAIDDNKSYEQIEDAIRIIVDDFDRFSNNCRNQFLQSFYYKNYNEKMAEICARA